MESGLRTDPNGRAEKRCRTLQARKRVNPSEAQGRRSRAQESRAVQNRQRNFDPLRKVRARRSVVGEGAVYRHHSRETGEPGAGLPRQDRGRASEAGGKEEMIVTDL